MCQLFLHESMILNELAHIRALNNMTGNTTMELLILFRKYSDLCTRDDHVSPRINYCNEYK